MTNGYNQKVILLSYNMSYMSYTPLMAIAYPSMMSLSIQNTCPWSGLVSKSAIMCSVGQCLRMKEPLSKNFFGGEQYTRFVTHDIMHGWETCIISRESNSSYRGQYVSPPLPLHTIIFILACAFIRAIIDRGNWGRTSFTNTILSTLHIIVSSHPQENT